MIAYINGKVIEKDANSVVVDVNGIGYEIYLTTGDSEKAVVDSPAKFYTYHSIKENSEDLFGFSSLASKYLFKLLISVQGVGPKAALAILSLGDNEEVRNAIANSDTKYIAGASGVGKKTADRIIVDLHDKVGLPTGLSSGANNLITNNQNSEAQDALIALGFSLADANIFLKDVPADLPTSEQIKLALKKR